MSLSPRDWLLYWPTTSGCVVSVSLQLGMQLQHSKWHLSFSRSHCSIYTCMGSAPLLSNILPHLQTLVNFIAYTLPKPVLVALLYRLIVLHFASRILPTIGADTWESFSNGNDGWDGRPVRDCTYPLPGMTMPIDSCLRRPNSRDCC